jgi:hypothetical protein
MVIVSEKEYKVAKKISLDKKSNKIDENLVGKFVLVCNIKAKKREKIMN